MCIRDSINPNQTEVPYNGIDEDCNPMTLDDDLDEDGFVLPEDCNDENPLINPSGIEIPDNGIDEDCDGEDLITTSVLDNDQNTVRIHPNPTAQFISIDTEELGRFEFELFDIIGTKLLTITNNNRIDLGSFLSGVYLLEITDLKTNKKRTERIVLTK